MSVAAMEALLLHHTLATDGLDEPSDPFFERSQRIVDDVWKVAVGADFQFPQTTGPKPFGSDFMNWYIARLNRKAHTPMGPWLTRSSASSGWSGVRPRCFDRALRGASSNRDAKSAPTILSIL